MQERCTGYSKNREDIEKTTIFPDEKAETHQSGGVHNVFQVNDHWRENKRRRNDFHDF